MNYSLKEIAEMIGVAPPGSGAPIAVSGVSTDTRMLRAGEIFFALKGEHHDGDRFVQGAFDMGAAAAVTHRVHDAGPCLVAPDPLAALQRFAAAHRARCDARVIAITGSCGKTTSKDMAAAVLGEAPGVIKTQGNLNNEIGCPLSLLKITPETRFAVIEMGANHMGEIERMCHVARPDESAVTLVAPSHLEGFGSIENVARAKGEIMEALPPSGCFYVNMDDPWCRAMADGYSGEKIRYGHQGDVMLESLAFDEQGEMLLTIAPVGRLRLPLRVRAHAANVLLAIAIGLRHGITEFEEPLRKACANAARFKTMRLGDIILLDDSYNANPASMSAALDALADQTGGARIAVLGSMFELGVAAPGLHHELGASVARRGLNRLVAMGPNAADMAAGAREAGLEAVDTPQCHEEAARLIASLAKPGDLALVKGSRGMRMETIIEMLREILMAEP